MIKISCVVDLRNINLKSYYMLTKIWRNLLDYIWTIWKNDNLSKNNASFTYLHGYIHYLWNYPLLLLTLLTRLDTFTHKWAKTTHEFDYRSNLQGIPSYLSRPSLAPYHNLPSSIGRLPCFTYRGETKKHAAQELINQ